MMHKNSYIFIIITVIFVFAVQIINIKGVQAAEDVTTFVVNLYKNIQNRDPDEEGKTYWINMLEGKKTTAADVAKSFLFSSEFLKKDVSNEQYIVILYKALQNRLPESEGKTYWTNLLNKGYSRLRILSEFVNSREFKNNCANYGIIPGYIMITNPIDKNPQTVSFITRLYNYMLNRKPDKDGLNYYVNVLSENRLNAADIVKQFVLSDEFKSKNLSNKDYVTVLYKALQNREPDINGLSYWINELNNYCTRLNVLSRIINSQEFKKVCENYNISVGSIALIEPIDKYPNIIPFINRFYNIFLDRNPDQDGLKYYVDLLGNNKITAAQFADVLLSSEEFKSKRISSNDYISKLYYGIQNRAPDKDGYNWWMSKLNNGYSRSSILACFVNSNEFGTQCELFGIIQGTLIVKNINTIILDAGHGGSDPGATGYGYKEADLNMQVVQKLGAKLQNMGFNVLYSRPLGKDVYVSLQDRAKFANDNNADLFISIHHDSSTSSSATGTSTHYSTYRPAIDADGVYVTYNGKKYPFIKEVNGTIYYRDGSTVKTVSINNATPHDSTPSEAGQKSAVLAKELVNALSSLGVSGSRGSSDHNLYVTRWAAMPSVLIEMGFISNKTEITEIANPAYQDKAAQKIADVIYKFFTTQ